MRRLELRRGRRARVHVAARHDDVAAARHEAGGDLLACLYVYWERQQRRERYGASSSAAATVQLQLQQQRALGGAAAGAGSGTSAASLCQGSPMPLLAPVTMHTSRSMPSCS